MIIYVYSYTDKFDIRHYQKFEISDEEANDWINVDYERRLAEALPGQVVERRTIQQIQDEIDREFVNSDRRNMYHKSEYQTFEDEDGEELNIAVQSKDEEGLTPMEQYEEDLRKKELKEKVDRALSILTETQKRRVIMRFVNEMTFEEIAKVEHCDVSTVFESIEGAIKKIRKNLNKTPKNDTPFRKNIVRPLQKLWKEKMKWKIIIL